MVIVGVLLLVVVAVIVIAIVARGDDPTSIDLGAFMVRTSFTGVFIAGAITVLVGVLGVMVLLSGLRRSRRRRTEIHELRDRAAAKEGARPGSPTPQPERADDRPGVSRSPTGTPSAGAHRLHPGDPDEPSDSAPRDR